MRERVAGLGGFLPSRISRVLSVGLLPEQQATKIVILSVQPRKLCPNGRRRGLMLHHTVGREPIVKRSRRDTSPTETL